MNECHGVSKQLFFEVEKSPRKRSFTEKRGNKCEEIISPQCAKHIKSNVNGWPMFVLLRERTMQHSIFAHHNSSTSDSTSCGILCTRRVVYVKNNYILHIGAIGAKILSKRKRVPLCRAGIQHQK